MQPKALDSVFGLEIFDNTDYESRLPVDWVPRTQGATMRGGAGLGGA